MTSFANLHLPQSLTIQELLGEGRRSKVYRAVYRSEPVVLKVYNQLYRNKYQQQYQVNIARFEFERNLQMYRISRIQRYVAKPVKLIEDTQQSPAALVQEFVGGMRLLDLIRQEGGLPGEVLQAGRCIIAEAAHHQLFDLDISGGNIRVLHDKQGWYPKLYDFNLMPQHLFPPNPFMRIAFALRLRSKNHRDYRSLREWQRHAQRASRGQSIP